MPRVESSIKYRYNLRSGPVGNLDHPSNAPASSNKPKKLTKRQRRRERREKAAEEKKLKKKAKQLAKQLPNQQKPKKDRKFKLSTTMRSFIGHATGPGVTIPFATEHKIKISLQGLLEEAMFNFCKDWAPEVLIKNNWLSPEMTELSLFARDLLHATNAKNGINTSMRLQWHHFIKILEKLHKLRHAAVHRVVVGEKGLDYIAADAVILLEAVQDVQRHAKMSMIRARITARDWERTLEALDAPLNSVPILPFYGKKIQSIDLTGDDDDAHALTSTGDKAHASGAGTQVRNNAEFIQEETDQVDGKIWYAAEKSVDQDKEVDVVKYHGQSKRKREVIDLTKDDDDLVMNEQVKRLDRSVHTNYAN